MGFEKVDQTIDISGKICPYTLIETREALKRLETGQVLEVLVDYGPAAQATIPNFCQKKGYPLETIEEQPGEAWRLLIQRTD
ncbi:MAG: sulfurtransferase TusA family protein [Anaerolineae bacterium]